MGAISRAHLRDPQTCPICGGDSELRFIKKGFPIFDCIDCDHRFVAVAAKEDHIESIYSDAYFQGTTGEYPDYLADKEMLISHGERYARMLDRYMALGTILDVGAAGGLILKGFEKMGWNVCGIEPNLAMAEHARRILGLDVVTGSIEEALIDGGYDLVSMIQVVAHFVDIRRAFEVASKLIKPEGYLLIESWNRDSWTARIFGEEWHEYNPPSVLHWFSAETLRALIEGFGFLQVASGKPQKWISLPRAGSIVSSKLGTSIMGRAVDIVARVLPEKLRFPYPLDDVYWALYQKTEPNVNGVS